MRNLLRSIQNLFSGPAEAPPPQVTVPQAAAILFAEVARADNNVKDIDLVAARQGLQVLFGLSTEQADALLQYAGRPENRPTSYFRIVSLLNREMSPTDKIKLIEQMWRVAQIDNEIDMYEDHIVRKIADLLYVPHREFIAAKHRAKNH